ncbi:hypothetical protein [Arenimonas sp.]|uniref:hypothetical protein n=1 Tax=Arenimonas sp. TaxID=1872635 RepID=UPI0039E39F4C
MSKRMLAGIALFCVLVAAAFAQSAYVNLETRLTPEQLRETGLDTLSAEQLAALNRLLRADAERMAKSAPAQGRETGGSAWQLGLDEKPIRSRLKGTLSGWEPGTEFELENGQRWKVLKGSLKLRKPLQSPEIEISAGVAGRWFLHFDENWPGARVYRVD